MISAPFGIEAYKRQPAFVRKAGVLPRALKGNVKLAAEVFVHVVCAPYVFMLERTFRQINARMHLAVIAAGGAEREIGLFINKQNAELIARKLPCHRAAGYAAADDENIGSVALKRLVAQSRHMHFLLRSSSENNIVYNVCA